MIVAHLQQVQIGNHTHTCIDLRLKPRPSQVVHCPHTAGTLVSGLCVTNADSVTPCEAAHPCCWSLRHYDVSCHYNTVMHA